MEYFQSLKEEFCNSAQPWNILAALTREVFFNTLWGIFVSLCSHFTSSIYYIETCHSLFSFCTTKLTACQLNPCPWPTITGLQKKKKKTICRLGGEIKTYLKCLLHIISYLLSVVLIQHLHTGALEYSQFIGFNIKPQNLGELPGSKNKCGQDVP